MAFADEADRDVAAALSAAWGQVRANLRKSAGARLFDQWLEPIALSPDSDGEAIRLSLPSPFLANWVRNHYADRLLLELRGQVPSVRTVTIEVRAAGDALPTIAAPVNDPAPAPAPVVAPAETLLLDPAFTLDAFAVDATNRVAFNAARLLAEGGPVRFSPLFLHGATGMGKTHLCHGIARAFLDRRPEARVLYMPAERFMFDFVAAMRARDTFAFKARLRGADLLIIDDLQFIAGKDATQEEFFHTINEVMAAGKRLVIAADRCPQALDGIEPRIVGRMAAGLVADIKAPGVDLRRAILERRRAALEVAVPDEVVALLVDRIDTSVRELTGALNRLAAYAQLAEEPITLEFALATLGESLSGARRRITIDDIQKAVSAHFDLKPLDLVSARRARAIARPRQIAMYLAKRLTTRSLPEIGRKFGGRDHSTVIHAVRRIEALRDSEPEVDGAVRLLLGELGG